MNNYQFYENLQYILNVKNINYLYHEVFFRNIEDNYYYHIDKKKTEEEYHRAFYRKIKFETNKNILYVNSKMVKLKSMPEVYFNEYIDLENYIHYYSKLFKIAQSYFEWDYKFFKFE